MPEVPSRKAKLLTSPWARRQLGLLLPPQMGARSVVLRRGSGIARRLQMREHMQPPLMLKRALEALIPWSTLRR